MPPVLAFLLLAGCGAMSEDAGADPAGPDAGGLESGAAPDPKGLPCDVAAVLEARCQRCHGSPGRYGAPMPLLTWSDTQATSKNGSKIWELMKARVGEGSMPPSSTPTGPLSPSEKAILLAWLDAGAPPGTATTCGAATGDAGAPEASAPSDDLPCTPTHRFVAHGAAAAEPFHVPPDLPNPNLYQCFSFPVPFTKNEQAIAWAPLIGDERVIHHWILYAVSQPPIGCNGGERTFITGWAPGVLAAEMPADVGLQLPDPGQHLLLEVHYHNATKLRDAYDRSGVAMCTTQQPRAQEAGVLTLGSTGINIPPGARRHPVVGNCSAFSTSTLYGPINVLSSGPHMHTRGVEFRTDHTSGGITRPLVSVPVWNFDDQRSYWHQPPVVVKPGDSLRTTCWYDNPGTTPVTFGEKTENEMCFNFAMVYPIANLPGRSCFY